MSLADLQRDIDAKLKQFERENEKMKQFSSVSEIFVVNYLKNEYIELYLINRD